MNIAFVVSSVFAFQTDGDFWEPQYVNYKYLFLLFITYSWVRVIYLQNVTEAKNWLCESCYLYSLLLSGFYCAVEYTFIFNSILLFE